MPENPLLELVRIVVRSVPRYNNVILSAALIVGITDVVVTNELFANLNPRLAIEINSAAPILQNSLSYYGLRFGLIDCYLNGMLHRYGVRDIFNPDAELERKQLLFSPRFQQLLLFAANTGVMAYNLLINR